MGIIVKCKQDSVAPLIKTLQWLPISLRIKSILLTQANKIPHNLTLACHVILIYSLRYHHAELALSLFTSLPVWPYYFLCY